MTSVTSAAIANVGFAVQLHCLIWYRERGTKLREVDITQNVKYVQ